MKKYDPLQTWAWNLEHAPSVETVAAQPPVPGEWTWCGFPISSPLGIPAGPLLDSHWLLHYANLGFDVLVYKTVRSVARGCYPLPNLVPVDADQLDARDTTVSATDSMKGSWAVSFGMPSQAPEVWRQDVRLAREHLPAGKVLVVSVVGTQDESIADARKSLEQLAEDFSLCALWAAESGAHGVEANFSCPNVSTADGQLFHHPVAAGVVAARIRERIGRVPLVLKIGRVTTREAAKKLLEHVGSHIDGLAMTNSISARVVSNDSKLLFAGQPRGICGAATRTASVAQIRMFRELLKNSSHPIDLIGVGGISKAEDVQQYLDAGATSIAIATAAMLNPELGMKIRAHFPGRKSVSDRSGSRKE